MSSCDRQCWTPFQSRCPALTSPAYILFYTAPGACYFIVDGLIETISESGARKGLARAAPGLVRFDLSLQGPLERCSAGSAGTVVRSLTDDCCLAVLLLSGREEAKAVLLGLRRIIGTT